MGYHFMAMGADIFRLYLHVLRHKHGLSFEDLGQIYRITIRGNSIRTTVVDYITLYPQEDPANGLSIRRAGNAV